MKRSPAGPAVLVLALLVALVVGFVAPAGTASAEPDPGWARWEPLRGSAGEWSTTVRLPAGGFPAATVTSDARGGVRVRSGGSVWLGAATPPGEVFGPSRGQRHLELRPRADRPDRPSTTTYSFERPTPAGGWALVLGDLDADRAVVTARGTDGRLLTGAELGWQGGFDYCGGPGSPSCGGTPEDLPTWDPATGDLLGNADATDTSGAAGWFRPTEPVTSLTVEFYQRSGFPVYQTWFGALAHDVAGTVRLVDAAGASQGVLPGAVLTLLGPDGTALGTATSDESGQYVFAGYVAAPGYRVELTDLPEADAGHPFGLVPYGERAVAEVDLRPVDVTGVDLAAREARPVAVSGTVLTDDGDPVAGATVTLTPAGGGAPRTAVTSSRGEYLIDGVGWDVADRRALDHTFGLTGLPEGQVAATVPDALTVAVGQERSSTGNDFVVRTPPAVSGRVTAGGEPVAGVLLTRTGPGGTVSTATASDGVYVFDGVPPGAHTVHVSPPDDYQADGPAARKVAVADDDRTGVDLTLSRPGAVGGVVTDGAGEPLPGATVTVAGLGGRLTVATDAAGGYFVDGLAPGDYLVGLVVPAGYTADAVERSVTVGPAGERRLAEDFAVAAVAEPGPTPTPSAPPSSVPSVTPAAGPTPEPSAGPPPVSAGDGTGAAGEPDGRGILAATGAAVGAVGLVAAVLVALGIALVRGARKPPGPGSAARRT